MGLFGKKKPDAPEAAGWQPVEALPLKAAAPPATDIETPEAQVLRLLDENNFHADFQFNPRSFSLGNWTRPFRPPTEYGLAIDGSANKICFIIHAHPQISIRIFDASEILEVELDEDDITVTKSSTGSVIGRALVGGALSGGLGAVVGGVTAKQEAKTGKVASIALKVLARDPSQPNWKVEFLPPGLVQSNVKDYCMDPSTRWPTNRQIAASD